MARLAVVAYPAIGERDRAWIETFRAEHDPQARLIGVHFTLVFPAELDEAAVCGHVRAVAAGTRPIEFEACGARAVRDPLAAGGHVFLVPRLGREEIEELHRRLYAGMSRAGLREEVPFVAHMTVAASEDFGRCERLAAELEAARRIVAGRVERMDVVAVGAGTVTTVAGVLLGGAS